MNQRQRIVTIVLLLSWIMILFSYNNDASYTSDVTVAEPDSTITTHFSAPIEENTSASIQKESLVMTGKGTQDQYQVSLQELISFYDSQSDPSLAELIVFQAIREYNFRVAHVYKEYLPTPLDPNLSLYLKLHSDDVRISNVKTIQSFLTEVDDMRMRNMISSDDYVFYRMLSQLWQRNIEDAILLAKQISSPKYE